MKGFLGQLSPPAMREPQASLNLQIVKECVTLGEEEINGVLGVEKTQKGGFLLKRCADLQRRVGQIVTGNGVIPGLTWLCPEEIRRKHQGLLS